MTSAVHDFKAIASKINRTEQKAGGICDDAPAAVASSIVEPMVLPQYTRPIWCEAVDAALAEFRENLNKK